MELSEEAIINKIYLVRGKKVMLDRDLAALYQVETRVLKQQVRRNIERFPEDFMLSLSKEEFDNLRSQNVISSWGGQRHLPFAFTEQGVAMLSSVLKSEVAIKVNIQIIRTFTKIREMLSTHKDVLLKLEKIERRLDGHDENIGILFSYLKELIRENEEPRKAIGFKPDAK